MRLYATITSERATKGQGGNEFLAIQVKNEKEKPVLTLVYNVDGQGKMYLNRVFGEYHQIHELYYIVDKEENRMIDEANAKRQKGEDKHIHQWGEYKEGENGEKIRWCKTCDATIDSDGGIIE